MNSRKLFSIYLFALAFICIPVLLASQYYVDDMGRAALGYTRWGIDGRPLSDFIMMTLNMGDHIVDLYPLPLILGISCLALSLVLIKEKLINENSFIAITIPLLFIASPSLSEMLSYRFDSLPMLVSISVTSLILAVRYDNYLLRMLSYGIISTCAFSTYQVSINLLVIIGMCEFLRRYINNDKPIRFLIEISISVIVSAIVYLKIILPYFFGGNHGGNHPTLSNNSIISTIHVNAQRYYSFLDNNVFNNNFDLFLIITLSVSVICSLVIIYQKFKTKKYKHQEFILSSFIVLMIPFFAFIFCVGSLLVLKSAIPFFTRIYVGVGGFIFLIAYYAYSTKIKIMALLYVPYTLCIVFYLVIYMFAYGNAVKAQDKYISSIFNEIKFLSSNINYTNIAFTGRELKPVMLINSEKKFPLLKYSVPQYLNNFYWPYRRMLMENLSLRRPPNAQEVLKYALDNKCRYSTKIEGKNFYLYLVKDTIIVDSDKSCK
ncbi:hypothetical protein FDW89_01635 [Citrobacter sp. wls830]|nr:hypothetical protein FDW89_01635 [Citrobacter sp. wls830]